MPPHPVPQPTAPEDPIEQFRVLWEVVRLLRRECPWDREQTHHSIAPLLIEEAYETVEAIRSGTPHALAQELGDLLLHVLMHSAIAEEHGEFRLSELIAAETAKLVHRHPHVFGEATADSAREVKQRWEELKLREGRQSVLEGIPAALPALLRAQRLQERASSVGLDWTEKHAVWSKVEEELAELRAALHSGIPERVAEEFGDVLFALVNVARFEGLNAEECLQRANEKFTQRFRYLEQRAAQQNLRLSEFPMEELDRLWEEAKRQESASQ
jgi:MazG family protein